MGESFKAVCSLVVIAAAVVAAFAFLMDRPTPTSWLVGVSASLVFLLSLGVLLKVHLRRDIVPDYLKASTGDYFNRDGFCFAISPALVDGICYLEVFFQNQYDHPCLARLALRPAAGFWLTRPEGDTITFDIQCAPAAFGVARLPIPLPKAVQGQRNSFEVGASVYYPQGKGRRLRFRDGIFLRADSSFGNAFGTALTAAGALAGHIVLSKPASVTMTLPSNAAEEIPATLHPEIITLWNLVTHHSTHGLDRNIREAVSGYCQGSFALWVSSLDRASRISSPQPQGEGE